MVKLMSLAEEIAETNAHLSMAICEMDKCSIERLTFLKRDLLTISSSLTGDIVEVYPDENDLLLKEFESTIRDSQEFYEQKIEINYRPLHAKFDQSSVINLTNTHIPFDTLLCISFGPKFIFPSHMDAECYIRFIRNFSNNINLHIPPQSHLEMYKHIDLLIHKYDMMTVDTETAWIKFIKYRSDKFFELHTDLLITKSDKGKHTVVIDKKSYTSKMDALVLSVNYAQLHNFNIQNLITKNNHFVDELFKHTLINNRFPLTDSAVDFSKLYGLIKVHKNGLPTRPIVSACNSPGFKLSKWLTNVLQNNFGVKGYHVKNSLEVVNRLNGLTISADEEMVSFDVVSMFTSIPISLILSIISESNNITVDNHIFYKPLLMDMLSFLLTDCAIFQWNNKIYKQIDSLAMGSPLSPILANIVMTRIMNLVIPKLKISPKILCIYVDDSFCIINKESTNLMLIELNKFHKNIKFTIEKENNGKLAFLNLNISHQNGSVITNWYRKPFASNRLLNFFSSHNRSTIINTAVSFIKNVLLLSNANFFASNKNLLEQILMDNCFPTSLILNLLHSHYTLMKPIIFNPKKNIHTFTSIKYIPNFTYPLLKRIKPIFPANIGITCAPESITSKMFSAIKDRNTADSAINSIIIIKCECGKKVILRHTSFQQRVSDVIKTISTLFDPLKRKCDINKHFFHEYNTKNGGKNHTETLITYRSLNFMYRNKLVDTKFDWPNNNIIKVLKRKQPMYSNKQ